MKPKTPAAKGRRKALVRKAIKVWMFTHRLGIHPYQRKSGVVFDMVWAKLTYDSLTHHFREVTDAWRRDAKGRADD